MPNDRSQVLAYVGGNLRRIREAAGVSQIRLAELAGISRRTILNLEAGDANVSLASLDRLAKALDVTFVELVAAPTAPSARIGAVVWRSGVPESEAVLLGSVPAHAEAQLWSWSLAAGDRYDAEPDPAGWHEMVFVTGGRLILEFTGSRLVVERGDYAVYPSSQPYSYVNAADGVTRFIRNVVW